MQDPKIWKKPCMKDKTKGENDIGKVYPKGDCGEL
jgi:hypothetical protein